MRKKIKQLMNKEEGFTLVELLAVIVILGIIVAIAIPSIGNLIDTAGSEAKEAEETLVVDAARLWEIKEGNSLTDTAGATGVLTVATLKAESFLENRESDMLDTATVHRDTTTGQIVVTGLHAN